MAKSSSMSGTDGGVISWFESGGGRDCFSLHHVRYGRRSNLLINIWNRRGQISSVWDCSSITARLIEIFSSRGGVSGISIPPTISGIYFLVDITVCIWVGYDFTTCSGIGSGTLAMGQILKFY